MFRTIAVAAAILTAVGCQNQGAIVDVDQPSFQNSNDVQGRLIADMPVTGAFEDRFSDGYVFKSYGMIDFELNANGEYGWGMLAGGFERPNIQAGESVTLQEFDHWVYACSGPDTFDAEFDEPAEEVTISKDIVEIDGEQFVEVTITASFSNGSEATGVVVRPVNGGDGNGEG